VASITGANFGTTRTNLLLRSASIGGTSWQNQNSIVVATASTDVTDPAGGTSSSKLTYGAANSQTIQSITLTAAVHTASVWVRCLSGTSSVKLYVFLQASPYTIIGETTFTVTSSWQRVSVTTSAATAAAYNFGIALPNSGSTIYVWGAQLEAGTNATAYIPTTTAAVSVFESSWYRQDEGTVYSETQWAFTHSATVPAGLSATWEIDNTATPTNNYCILGNSATTSDQSQGRNPTVGLSRPSIYGFGFKQANVLYKTAFGYDSSVLLHSTNRLLSTVNANTVAALMAPHDRLLIGQATGGASPYQVNGTIKRLCFWPTRLPNSTLQAITQ
jgi:hypothetical protein